MKTGFEDRRTELKTGYVLNFPGMECIVDECIGKGSNAIVYLGHYADYQMKDMYHRILIKELYPFDENEGICRDQDGCIVVSPSAEKFYAIHKKSYLNGNRFHLKLLADNPGELDSHINTFEYHNTLYSILEFTGGRSMLQELEKNTDISLERIIRWMKGLLSVLKVFHEAGYLHLDISLDNILLTGEAEKERVTLIDYNSIVSLNEVQGDGDIILSSKKGYEYTASEILRAEREKIGPCTDLYSVTAVFFHLLFQRGRSVIERKNRFVLPDISKSLVLKGQNPIVTDMISVILKKGFETNVRFRYQNVDQMRADLDELEERINCRGITQWALWQKGKDHVTDIVRRNTALRFIMDPKKIYPLKAQRLSIAEGQTREITLSDSSFLKEMSGTKPVLLLGGGGMGKTTTMLRIAYDRQQHYTAGSTAILYISLFGWKNGDRTYIQDKILENLDFSHEVLENARKELRHLLAEPIRTKVGDVPKLLLCLDGLNEASGDITPLLNEIEELCALSGIKMILTSRSEIAGDEFEKWMISRLDQEEVRTVLKQKRIPEPENMEIMELLHVPMMLSMYMEALSGRKILKLDSKDELLEEYLSVLMRKEARDFLNTDITGDIQDNSAYFGAQVAVKYVLPEIAALLQKKKRSLTEKEVYHCVEECYKYLDQKAFTGVFDKWIGHTTELKLGTKNADEWHGRIVQDILWKKLGLLVKDMEQYRISHQMIEDYMKQKSDEFHVQFDLEKKKLRDRKRWFSGAAVMAVVMLFGLYNFYMSGVLRVQKEEAQKNESVSLAYSSGEKLREGDRTSALQMALSALPAKENDRPYVASAEKALTDALYVYEDDSYQAMHRMKLSAGNWKYALTTDGSCIIGLDENGYVRCYNLQSEKLIWSYSSSVIKEETNTLLKEYHYDEDRVSSMYLIESQNAVLLAGKEDGAVLLSIDSGKEIWKLDYSELDEEIWGDIQQISLSKNEKILAIGYETRKGNDSYNDGARFKKLSFIDVTTGKQISKTDAIPVSFSIYCSFTENGVFSENNQIYAALLCDVTNKTYHLVMIDPLSGEVEETAWIKRENVINNRGGILSKLFYVSPNENYAGGFLVYIYGYDHNFSRGYDGACQLAYLEEGASEWNYHRLYDFELQDNEIPDLISNDRENYFIHNNQIIELDRITGEQRGFTEKMEENIVYYFLENDKMVLILENGKKCAVWLSSLKDAKGEKDIVCAFKIQGAMGDHNSKNPFVLIPEDDANSVILYEWIQNDHLVQTLAMPDWFDDALSFYGRVFVLPNEKGFLYLEDQSKDDGNHENRGTLYNMQGEIVDTFSFITEVNFVTDELQVSEEGRWLVGSRYRYDMTTHQLICLEDILPEHASVSNLRTAVTKSGIRSVCLKENQLYIWEEGKEYRSGTAYEEIIELSDVNTSRSKNPVAKAFENIYFGKNGRVILCCSESEETEISQITGRPTDYYLVYSLEQDKWVRIENETEENAFPILAVANENALFAACDFDKRMRIYDAEKGRILYEYETNVSAESIKDMKFILDDRYLVILTGESIDEYQIIRMEDGQRVYHYTANDDWNYTNLVVQEEQETNRIYLFDNEHNMNAVGIDTRSWTELDAIEGLRGVLKKDTFIVQNGYSELQLHHRYDLDVLMQKAQEVLNAEE